VKKEERNVIHFEIELCEFYAKYVENLVQVLRFASTQQSSPSSIELKLIAL
jgi:hypothetical protein